MIGAYLTVYILEADVGENFHFRGSVAGKSSIRAIRYSSKYSSAVDLL